jgi:hypothetical protein
MGVYEDAEELPEGKKAIGCRWVYEFKINESGGPPTYKARLVAQGFSQVPFVDYDATFAPVAKSVTVRFVAVYSALQGWHLQCFDATRAFLHGGLVRVLFMRRPRPLPPGLWRLLKSIYGLKQASRVWYRLLRKVLETLGFTRSEFDHALFIFNRTWGSSLVHCLLACPRRRRSCWLQFRRISVFHQVRNQQTVRHQGSRSSQNISRCPVRTRALGEGNLDSSRIVY